MVMMMMMMMMMMMNTNAMPALEGKVIFLGPFPPAWGIVEISPFLPTSIDWRPMMMFRGRSLVWRVDFVLSRPEVFLFRVEIPMLWVKCVGYEPLSCCDPIEEGKEPHTTRAKPVEHARAHEHHRK